MYGVSRSSLVCDSSFREKTGRAEVPRVAGLCKQFSYDQFLENWALYVPAKRTLLVKEEPWPEVRPRVLGNAGHLHG